MPRLTDTVNAVAVRQGPGAWYVPWWRWRGQSHGSHLVIYCGRGLAMRTCARCEGPGTHLLVREEGPNDRVAVPLCAHHAREVEGEVLDLRPFQSPDIPPAPTPDYDE